MDHIDLLAAAYIDAAEKAEEGQSSKHLASLSILYLRPASCDDPLFAASYDQGRGRAASFIDTVCYHKSDLPIVTAKATFVA